MAFEPVLTSHVREPNSYTLDFYLQSARGYEGLRKALTLQPNDLIELVKASGLRGRGGAGFPTGLKWQFVHKDTPKPKYICCNADESEPGTFKDHVLMERNPHLLIEGCAISCYAIGAKVAYIYIRGEFYHVQEMLEAEIEKAYKAGFLGKNIFGSGFDCDVYVHRGAGAYEAGEETALIESLEGKRAQPRIKPPFPAVAGLYQCPTAVNNVETLCNVPPIVLNGAEWFAAPRPGEERRPEAVLHQRPREAARRLRGVDAHDAARADLRRAVRAGHARRQEVQGDHPGRIVGAAAARRAPRHARQLRRRAEGRVAARLGRPDRARRDGVHGVAGDEPAALLPPRVVRQVHAVPRGRQLAVSSCCSASRRGEGRMKDIDLLFGVANNIVGKTLCAFGDAAATPVLTTLKLFRHEFEAHVRRAAARCRPSGAPSIRWWRTDGLLQLLLRPAVIGLMIFIVFNALIIASAILVYAERKIMGFMQQRYGPYLVGPHGMLQPFADILKLLFKEELRPKGADKWLFTLAPVLAVVAAFAAFATVPFGAETTLFGLLDEPIKLGVADVNVGVLVVFAVTSMGVYGIVLAGWASNSKYSLFGGLRASAQMISYELSYATALAAVILLAGSMSLREVVDSQAGTWLGFIPQWYIFLQPRRLHHLRDRRRRRDQPRARSTFPEAEQELVAGFNTEYSSVRFALFPQAEYINMVTMSAVATDLYLGGWHFPVVPDMARVAGVPGEGRRSSSSSTSGCAGRCRATATTS